MRLFTRLIVCAAAAMVLSAILFYVADAWFGKNTSVVGAGRQIVLEARRTEALQARKEMIALSLSTKYDIIDQLLAGRLNFRQAVIQFQRANELVENVDLDLIPLYRTPTTPEGVGRQLFMWASNSVASWPTDKAERFLAGLEREYQELFKGAKLEEEIKVRPTDLGSSDRTETHSMAW